MAIFWGVRSPLSPFSVPPIYMTDTLTIKHKEGPVTGAGSDLITHVPLTVLIIGVRGPRESSMRAIGNHFWRPSEKCF